MKKQVGKIFLCLLTIIMVFFNLTFASKATDYDFGQYVTQVGLTYEKEGQYVTYDQTALPDPTQLRLQVVASLPKSSLDVNNSIRFTLPEGITLEDTTAPVSALYAYGGLEHDYSQDGAIGSYTVANHQMTISFNNLINEIEDVYLQMDISTKQLTFNSNHEATLTFTSPSTTITVKKAVKTTPPVKRATLKANLNSTDNNGNINELNGNINESVKNGLSGAYRLTGETTVDNRIGSLAININNDVTIDLNGKKLQIYDGLYFDILKGAHLTILDSTANLYQPEQKATTNQKGNISTVEKNTQNDPDNRAVPTKLTYYVTEAKPNDTTTSDTTKQYEVDLSSAGRIYSETSKTGDQDSTFMIEKGGTLNFESGVAYNKGPHVVATKGSQTDPKVATMNLIGGYLIGNCAGNVIYNNAGNVLNISGGVITQGKANNGGAIYNDGLNSGTTKGGTINLTGGIITGNEADLDSTDSVNNGTDSDDNRYSGGGIYMKSGTLNISGDAYITNNTKSSGDSSANHFSLHGGGGIAVDNDAAINMSGGYVTGNYSHEAGGGIYCAYFAQNGLSQLTMTGGTIASNIAQTGEGGGIRIGGSGRGVIRATSKDNPIYITNNTTNTGRNEETDEKHNGTGDWGGGGIFIQQNGMLNIMNTIITTNTADGFGAGVSACPTGDTNINTDQGAAIYSNVAQGKHYSRGSGAANEQKNEDYAAYKYYENNKFTSYQDYFLAHAANVGSYTITNGMLGGGSEGYTGTFNNNQSLEQHYNADGVEAKFIGLSANPSADDINKALDKASTYISGNHSHNHGGGIMTNGMLTLGESNEIYPSFHVEAYKAFKLKSALDDSTTNLRMDNNQFKFAIYKHTGDSTTPPKWDGNKFTAGSGTNDFVTEVGNENADKDQLGRIYASIPNFLYDNPGDYTFYLVEKNTDEHYVTFDHSVYQIQFKVVESSGTTIVNNVETKTYKIQDLTITKYENGTPTSLTSSDYSYADSKLTLYNNTKETFKNTEQSFDLKLTKKDKDKNTKTLSGAEFELYRVVNNYNDADIQTVNLVEQPVIKVTDDQGELRFSSIRGGELYYLKETKAPDQYKTSGPWMIKVEKNGTAMFYDANCIEKKDDSTGYLTLTKNSKGTFWKGDGTSYTKDEKTNTLSFTITDEAIQYKLPETGGSGIDGYYQKALFLLGIGFVIVSITYIKRRFVK